MSQNAPDPKFTNLRPSQKLPGLTSNQPANPEPKCTLATARSMILAALLPCVREEAILGREQLQMRRWWNMPRWELNWLLIPEAQEWTEQDWWDRQDMDLSSVWSIPMTDGPELDQWLLEMHPEMVFQNGWAGDLFYLDGHLMYEQVILRQAEIQQKEGTRRVEEAKEAATWIVDQVRALISGARLYREWKMDEVRALERRWPDWLDLEQIWIGCDSDSMGDRMALMQGPKEQMEAATRNVVLAQRVNGLEVGVRLNAWFERLSPMQAVIVMPSALEKGLLLRLL